MRLGQKNGCVRQWAEKGSRRLGEAKLCLDVSRSISATTAYVFGAVCPARDTGAALVLPYANTHAMQLHIEAISKAVAPGAHAVVRLDNAGWHTTQKLELPPNLSRSFCRPLVPN